MSSPPAASPVTVTELQPVYVGHTIEVAEVRQRIYSVGLCGDDSSYGGPAASSDNGSLASSILSYTYENGRRYPSDRFKGESFMPNDKVEQDRLDVYHYLFLRFLGGELYTAPLVKEKVHRVLDVGTGTGIWVIDFADAFPQAEIRATDLSPIQPTWCVIPTLSSHIIKPPANRVVPAVAGQRAAASRTGTSHSPRHTRAHPPPPLLPQHVDVVKCSCLLKRHLALGGYVEFQDYSGELFNSDGVLLSGPDRFPNGRVEPYDSAVADTSAVAYILHLICKASIKGGPIARTIANNIKNAGFEEVSVKKIILPLGAWPKDKNLRDLSRGYLGYAANEVNDLVEKGKKDMLRGKYYSEGWFVYGKKLE
ncbi:hypothetical protein DFH27DRAFT_645042 [Peziza echinospora]|nr:hypothetical protein DFH27DRAFT_645042 [Peziza echinospora]